MSSPGANPTRRTAAGGGAHPNKDQPTVPPETTSPAAPRPSTPNSSRTTQHTPRKPVTRSGTIDQPAASTGASKQPTQPSAPPGNPVHPNPPASAPAQRTPNGEREAFIQPNAPNAFVEELKAKIAKLESIVQQQGATIQHQGEKIQKQESLLQEKEADIDQKRADIEQKRVDIEQYKEQVTYYYDKANYLSSDAYRQEVVSIRRHLQVDEACEPWEINKRFGEIVRKAEDISRDLGETLGSLPPLGKPTTRDLLNLILLAPESQNLAAAEPVTDLEIDDFIDFGCRALINGMLYNRILGPSIFHPALKPEDNTFYCNIYGRIRKAEPQVVAGRWRISTLKLHAHRAYSPKDDARHLFKEALVPFCSTVVDLAPRGEELKSILSRLEDLFQRAYDWNHLVKNSVITLDFHPQYQPPGSAYNPDHTSLEGRRPKPPSSKAILLTSKLGLWSSNAVGEGKEPEYTIQVKPTMVATEFFV